MSEPSPIMSRDQAAWVDVTDGRTAGYPVHRVTRHRRWTNRHGAEFTDWVAACGATRTTSGHHQVFGQVSSARRAELCRTCWPSWMAR